MARHSPTDLSPLRKRHPTFERIATSAPISSSSTITSTSSINNLQSFDSNSTRENSTESTIEAEENKTVKIQKFTNILYRQNSKNISEEKPSFNVLDHALQRLQNGFNPSIIKLMSDCTCYKMEKATILDNANKNKNEEDIIEENQATVGHGRGKWAKDIVVGRKISGIE